MPKKGNSPKRKKPQPYETYALAEDSYRDKRTNAAHPSEENVEQMRDWSIQIKL